MDDDDDDESGSSPRMGADEATPLLVEGPSSVCIRRRSSSILLSSLSIVRDAHNYRPSCVLACVAMISAALVRSRKGSVVGTETVSLSVHVEDASALVLIATSDAGVGSDEEAPLLLSDITVAVLVTSDARVGGDETTPLLLSDTTSPSVKVGLAAFRSSIDTNLSPAFA